MVELSRQCMFTLIDKLFLPANLPVCHRNGPLETLSLVN